MKRIPYIFICALLAVSCIYPFEPEGVVSQKRIVFEGDILIGQESVITVRSTMPIIYDEGFDTAVPFGHAFVEDNAGNTYRYSSATSTSNYLEFRIDTRQASPDNEYRLHFIDERTRYDYVSSWQKVVRAPEITGMSFDYDNVAVNVRMDVDGGETSHFRWDYSEDWEYHAEYIPFYWFNEETQRVEEYPAGEPNFDYYWCWNSASSNEFGLASTETQSANRLDRQIIATRGRSNIRFQSCYRMNVLVRGLTKDAYDYLRNMLEISDITGSLFSPSPDDMRGNMVCQQDSTEFVIGYISAVEPVIGEMYIGPDENGFYREPAPTTLYVPVFDENNTILDYYRRGLRPVMDIPDGLFTSVGWGPERCINCLSAGGTKKRPDNWPTFNE